MPYNRRIRNKKTKSLKGEEEKAMKYNKKVIMKRAWIMAKSFGLSMSVALKGAWALAKALLAAEKEGKESGWNYKRLFATTGSRAAIIAPTSPLASTPTLGTASAILRSATSTT